MTQVSLPSIRSIFPEYVNGSNASDDDHHHHHHHHQQPQRRESTVRLHSLTFVMSHSVKSPYGNDKQTHHQSIPPLRLPHHHHHHHHQQQQPQQPPNPDYYPPVTHHHHHQRHSPDESAYYHHTIYPPQGSTSPQLGGMMKDMHLQHPDDDESNMSGSDDSEGVSVDDYERKHVCPHCSKRFNRPSSLRIHVNTHTGATPFKCPWPDCGRNFNVNSNMRRHYRNHFSNASAKGGRPALGQTLKPTRRSKSPTTSSSSSSSGSSTPANFVFVTSPPGLPRQRS